MARGAPIDSCKYCGRRTGRRGHLCVPALLAGKRTITVPPLAKRPSGKHKKKAA